MRRCGLGLQELNQMGSKADAADLSRRSSSSGRLQGLRHLDTIRVINGNKVSVNQKNVSPKSTASESTLG